MGFSCRLSESVVAVPEELGMEVTVPPVVVALGIFVPCASLLLSPLDLLVPLVVPGASSVAELLPATLDEVDLSLLLDEDVPADEPAGVDRDVELRERLRLSSLATERPDCVPWALDVAGREEVAFLLDDPTTPLPSAAPLEDRAEDCADAEELLKSGKPATPVAVNEPREVVICKNTDPHMPDAAPEVPNPSAASLEVLKLVVGKAVD